MTDVEPYHPTETEEGYYLGWQLGREPLHCQPSSDRSPDYAMAFIEGWIDGYDSILAENDQ